MSKLKDITVNLAVGQTIMVKGKPARVTKIEFHPKTGEISLNTTEGPRPMLTFGLVEESAGADRWR